MITQSSILRASVATMFGLMLPSFGLAFQAEIKDRVSGRWEASAEKTKTYLSEHKDAESLPQEFLDNLPKIVFEFTSSGETIISMDDPTGDSRTLKGKWEVKKEKDEKNATLHVVMMVDEKEDAKDVEVEFIDDETLALSIEEQPTLVFVRAKEKAAEQKSEKKESDK